MTIVMPARYGKVVMRATNCSLASLREDEHEAELHDLPLNDYKPGRMSKPEEVNWNDMDKVCSTCCCLVFGFGLGVSGEGETSSKICCGTRREARRFNKNQSYRPLLMVSTRCSDCWDGKDEERGQGTQCKLPLHDEQ